MSKDNDRGHTIMQLMAEAVARDTDKIIIQNNTWHRVPGVEWRPCAGAVPALRPSGPATECPWDAQVTGPGPAADLCPRCRMVKSRRLPPGLDVNAALRLKYRLAVVSKNLKREG